MHRYSLLVLLAITAVLFFPGCGPTVVSVSVVRPAQVDLEGIDKIMIGGINGSGGAELAKSLSMTIADHPHYTLLDDTYFNGLIAKGYAVEFGGTAFIQGNVETHIYTEKLTEDVIDKPEGKKETRYRKTGTAEVEALLKVVDPNTGAVLGMRQIRKSAVANLSSVNEKPRPINKNSLLASARGQIVSEFMKLIVPYREQIGLTFAEEKNIPEMEGALQFVKANQWDAAVSEYKRIGEMYGSAPGVNVGAAYFNIGLCRIVLKQYDSAIDTFNQAMRFSPALASRAGYEISKVKRLQSDIVRLKKQMEGGEAQSKVTVVKVEPKAEAAPLPKAETAPVKTEVQPETVGNVHKIPSPNSWTKGGVEAELMEIAELSPEARSIFRMPIQVAPGFKLIGIKAQYKNLSNEYKNYALMKTSVEQLPELSLSTDRNKTYFRSMHTLGLMVPFGGLKPQASYICWAVFEIPSDEKPEKLLGLMMGNPVTWELK